jgi:cysteine desulfurase
LCLDGFTKAIAGGDAAMASVMWANNETGVIQPIAEACQIAREAGVAFHTDAIQAVGKTVVNVREVPVDYLSISGHKLHAPKGVGAMYIREGLKFAPMLYGGGQEGGRRSGTENVAGIVAAGYAIEENIREMAEMEKRLNEMVGYTINGIKEKIPSVRVNGDNECRLPGTVNLGFDGISGESLMHLLDLKGICVSTSSACTSGKDEPSHVLLALGLTEQQAKSAIRISYGRYNTVDEAKDIINAVCEAYAKIIDNC